MQFQEAGVSTYEQISNQLDQAEATMRDAERRLGNFESLRPILAELSGHADAADGLVSVDWTAQGLSGLEINPRAMRLPAAELAEAIKTAVRAAADDLRQKTRAALADAGIGADSAMSIEEVQAQLARLREQTIDNANRTLADLDRAMRLRRESGR